MRKPLVKLVNKVLVSYLSYPCDRTSKTLCFTSVGVASPLSIVPGLCGYFKLFLEGPCSMFCCEKAWTCRRADYDLPFFAKGTSVYKGAFPLGTFPLVKGVTEAGGAGRVRTRDRNIVTKR